MPRFSTAAIPLRFSTALYKLFMKQHEKAVWEFIDRFNGHLAAAVEKIKTAYPQDSLSYLNTAHLEFSRLKPLFKQQKEIEKFLMKLNRKVIDDLKKERARN